MSEAYGKPGFEIAAEALGIEDALFRPTRELDALYRRVAQESAARAEAKVRGLLGQWASEIPPAIAIGQDGDILGLCDADAPLGSKSFIFRGHASNP
jgi:hypothetical protein